MNTIRRYLGLFWLTLALALGGCGTQLKGLVRADPGASHGYRNLDSGAARTAVRVTRNGGEVSDPLGARLQKGDIIETGEDVSAVLRFADGNEAILGPRTRVRLGSLEVFFGKVFASVRGAFVVSSDTVSAEVEGTEYLFEQPREGEVRVVVLDGTVTCRSPQSRWADARVNAGRMFDLSYATRATPQVVAAPADLMLSIRRWADAVRAIATPRFKLPFELSIGIGVGGFGGGERGDGRTSPDMDIE